MRIAEEQYSSFHLKAAVCVMNIAFAGSQANLIKIFPAIDLSGIGVTFNLPHIKASQLKLVIKILQGSFKLCIHTSKLRNSTLSMRLQLLNSVHYPPYIK